MPLKIVQAGIQTTPPVTHLPLILCTTLGPTLPGMGQRNKGGSYHEGHKLEMHPAHEHSHSWRESGLGSSLPHDAQEENLSTDQKLHR